MHLAAVDLRGVGVAHLVDEADDAEKDEELEGVDQRLAEERVELVGPRPDRRPVLDEDAHGEEGQDGPETTIGGVQIQRTYSTLRLSIRFGSKTWNMMKKGLKPSAFSSAARFRAVL